MVNLSKKDWSLQLTDTLWAYRTAYKTNLGMSPYRLVYGKACHLPIKIEHQVLWAIKKLNFDVDKSRATRKLQISELEEIRNDVYESAKVYKARTKAFHDKCLIHKHFEPNQKVFCTILD